MCRRPGRRWTFGVRGSAREEVGSSETCGIKWRYPGGGGYRHLIADPTFREEEERQVVLRSALKGGGGQPDP